MPTAFNEDMDRLGRDFKDLSPEKREGILRAARGLLAIQVEAQRSVTESGGGPRGWERVRGIGPGLVPAGRGYDG